MKISISFLNLVVVLLVGFAASAESANDKSNIALLENRLEKQIVSIPIEDENVAEKSSVSLGAKLGMVDSLGSVRGEFLTDQEKAKGNEVRQSHLILSVAHSFFDFELSKGVQRNLSLLWEVGYSSSVRSYGSSFGRVSGDQNLFSFVVSPQLDVYEISSSIGSFEWLAGPMAGVYYNSFSSGDPGFDASETISTFGLQTSVNYFPSSIWAINLGLRTHLGSEDEQLQRTFANLGVLVYL